MKRPYNAGAPVKVWVILKSGSKTIDSLPHLIETHVTNGYNCWFSRTVTTAVCGRKRRGIEGWRSVPKGNKRDKTGVPELRCETCFRLDLMHELSQQECVL